MIAYQLLRQGTVYADLGPTYFDERNRQVTQRRLVRRLEQIGLRVTVEPVALPIQSVFSEQSSSRRAGATASGKPDLARLCCATDGPSTEAGFTWCSEPADAV